MHLIQALQAVIWRKHGHFQSPSQVNYVIVTLF